MTQERIIISDLAIKDAADIHLLMTSNTSRFLRFFSNTLKQNSTIKDSKIFIQKKKKEQKAKEEYTFLVKENLTKKIVGLLIIKEINWVSKQGELAYCIDQGYEGKGLMTEAVNSVSNFALRKLELRTLQIIVHKSNLGSIRVAEKCNYIWQKTLKDAYAPPNEEALDMELYELKA